jgi:trimeric autotransporter adhesin
MPRAFAPGLLSFLVFGAAAVAQCDPAWSGSGSLAGTNGAGLCVTNWDPDGPGPLPVHAVIGGGFRSAGTIATSNVAAWNPTNSQWRGFGNGLADDSPGSVQALAVTASGALVAGGTLRIGGSTANEGVAIWSGTSWSPLRGATGLALTRVTELHVASTGDLFACANWLDVGNVTRAGVARWDGSSWSVLGAPFASGSSIGLLLAICELPGGDLVVAGRFDSAGGVPAASVARWNGASWSAVGSGFSSADLVYSLDVMANGNLVAGGDLRIAFGGVADGVATFDGTNWTQLGTGLSTPLGTMVQSVEVQPNGDVIACGAFVSSAGAPVSAAARWDGAAWSQLGTGIDVALGEACYGSTLLPDGRLLVVGSFRSSGGVPTRYAALWNGLAWAAMTTAGGTPMLDGTQVTALVAEPNGTVVVGGNFLTAGGVSMPRIARWDGTSFTPLGSGANGQVTALAREADGAILAAGNFSQIGGVAAAGFARWNGSAWSPMGNAVLGPILVARTGEIYASAAAGSGVRRWNGTTWVAVGTGWPAAGALALAELPDGELLGSAMVFSGHSTPQFHLLRLTGGVWVPYGAPLNGAVHAILATDTEVYVGGGFSFAGGGPANFVARHDNGNWQTLGSGPGGLVTELELLPDGDLVAAGQFSILGGVPALRIARYDGAWTPIDGGLDGSVFALARTDSALYVGGAFSIAGSVVAQRVAKLTTPCPASATPYGAGCVGVGGPMVLMAERLPYLGATYRSASTGFGPNAFGVWEIGTGQLAVPVSAILPEGGPGCTQWTLLDLAADLVLPTGGVARGSIFVPASPALVGGVVYNQMALIELDPLTSAIVRIATSNGLAMTIGAF